MAAGIPGPLEPGTLGSGPGWRGTGQLAFAVLFEVEPPRGPACLGGLKALHLREGHFCFLLCEKEIVI